MRQSPAHLTATNETDMEPKKRLNRKERRILAVAKEKFLRQIAEMHLTREHLIEIFGMAIRAKLTEPSNPHNSLGENYFNSHGPHHHVRSTAHNPATTKLIRSFIRGSGKESTFWRLLYKQLTGEQYNGVEA